MIFIRNFSFWLSGIHMLHHCGIWFQNNKNGRTIFNCWFMSEFCIYLCIIWDKFAQEHFGDKGLPVIFLSSARGESISIKSFNTFWDTFKVLLSIEMWKTVIIILELILKPNPGNPEMDEWTLVIWYKYSNNNVIYARLSHNLTIN